MKYFKADVRNGRLVLDNQHRFRKYVAAIPEGRFLLSFIRMSDRSLRDWQKWYRVILKEMSNDTGHSPSEMHEFCKSEVLSKMKLDSTTQLDNDGWNEYMELIKQWALESFDFII